LAVDGTDGLSQRTATSKKRPFEYEQVRMVVPELLEAIAGELKTGAGENAGCVLFRESDYPHALSGLLDHLASGGVDHCTEIGSVRLDKPLVMVNEDTFIFRAVKFMKGNGQRASMGRIDEFVSDERKRLRKNGAIPAQHDLCFYLVVENNHQNTVTIASAARPQNINIG